MLGLYTVDIENIRLETLYICAVPSLSRECQKHLYCLHENIIICFILQYDLTKWENNI